MCLVKYGVGTPGCRKVATLSSSSGGGGGGGGGRQLSLVEVLVVPAGGRTNTADSVGLSSGNTVM